MKLNKVILASLTPALVTTGLCITNCSNKSKDDQETILGHKFFKTPMVDNTVYTITPPSDNYNHWYVTLQSLQGILAQTNAKIFVRSSDSKRNEWFDSMKAKMGFRTVEVEDPRELLALFAPEFSGKYVLYKENVRTKTTMDYNSSIDKAATIAAAERVIMVEESIANTIESWGYSQYLDATQFTTAQLFNKYKNYLNNSMLINQKPNNHDLFDYAIASKSFCTYLEYVKNGPEQDTQVCKDILNWTKPGSPILGWNEDEMSFVETVSSYNKVVTPSDYCANLSFYSAYNPNKIYTQKHKEKITAQDGKHYVAIVMSDGDNVQWLQSGFSTDENYFGSQYRGQFPITWTLSPAPYTINPGIVERLYSLQSDNDCFICGPSGYGYMNYDHCGNPKAISEASAWYMKAVDQKVCDFLDSYQEEKDPDKFNEAMDSDQFIGGIWGFGDWYIKGNGGVYWRKDKPIICMREALWELEGKSTEEQTLSPEQVAARINNYSTNPKEISGYTLVAAHAWSYGKMDSVKKFYDLLDKDHVELVTVEQLINMVSENVPHVDDPKANAYPIVTK